MRFCVLILVFLAASPCFAQNFQLNGTAVARSGNCYRLTPNEMFTAGSIWQGDKIDLNQDFEIKFEINLGCLDADGADGVVFGFQNVNTSVGGSGEGIGFEGISPSVGFEFDTWQNINLNDPVFDHLALMLNGNMNHNSNLAGPVQISASSVNVEDCQRHPVSIVWDSSLQNLSAFFECQERISFDIDLVNTVFGGDSEVFWGFTSATGGSFNEHIICFDVATQAPDNRFICVDGEVQLDIGAGESFVWTPSTGLNNPNIAKPIASPLFTTTYDIEITDKCGDVSNTSLTVEVVPTPMVSLGGVINSCVGDTVTLNASNALVVNYDWSTGEDTPIIEVTKSGTYEVVLGNGVCLSTVSVEVLFEELPMITLDTVTCENSVMYSGVEIMIDESVAFPLLTDGCEGTIVVNVVEDDALNCIPPCSLETPTAFSPNFDNLNDRFSLRTDCELVSLQIYDRWGHLVFETSQLAEAWDGTLNGETLPVGIYAWLAETMDVNFDSKAVWTGNVTLIQ